MFFDESIPARFEADDNVLLSFFIVGLQCQLKKENLLFFNFIVYWGNKKSKLN